MAGQHGRLWNALDGRELKRAIVREVEDMLDADDRFVANVTYPKVSFSVSVNLKVYPREPESFTVTAGKTVGESNGEPIEVSLDRQVANDHPDKIRMAIGAPLPHPQQVKGVGVVDVTAEQLYENRAAKPYSDPDDEEYREPDAEPEPDGPREPPDEPLIVPATEMPSAKGTAKKQHESVTVGGASGRTTQRQIEIDGHNTAPRPIQIPREPARKVSIANSAAVEDGWAEANGMGRPVAVESKVPDIS